MNKKFSRCLFLFSFVCIYGFAQDLPIGYWRSHMPYNNAISAATDGITIFSGSSESFFTYNAADHEISTYSKPEGMSDVGMAYIGYDAATGYAIIAYSNGNIDLFKDETFYNIPDIKLKTISPKKINHIYTENGMAYLSTSFGVAVLNLSKKRNKGNLFIHYQRAIHRSQRIYFICGSFFCSHCQRALQSKEDHY